MENNRRPDIYHMADLEAHIFTPNVVSTTECTGMLYRQPMTDMDVDGYAEIYPVIQTKGEDELITDVRSHH